MVSIIMSSMFSESMVVTGVVMIKLQSDFSVLCSLTSSLIAVPVSLFC